MRRRDRRDLAHPRRHVRDAAEPRVVPNGPEPCSEVIGAGQDGDDARRGQRRSRVDRDDARVRMRRADEHDVSETCQYDVVDIAVLAQT